MKKTFTMSVLVALVMTLFSFTGMAMANQNSQATEWEAKEVGFFQILMDMKATPISPAEDAELMSMAKEMNFNAIQLIISGQVSPWKGKEVYLGSAIPVYDVNDSLHSYLFNLTADGSPAGFIEIVHPKTSIRFLLSPIKAKESILDKCNKSKKRHQKDRPLLHKK